jgi:hypothetical protein
VAPERLVDLVKSSGEKTVEEIAWEFMNNDQLAEKLAAWKMEDLF